MATFNRLKKNAVFAVCSAALLVAVSSPSWAQLSQAAQAEASCIEAAQEDGYTVNNVVSVKEIDADTVQVVLNLTRDGVTARLTCPYSLSQGVGGFAEDIASTVTHPGWGRLWWLLLPIIGFPLLLWALQGRNREVVQAAAADEVIPTEGFVNTSGDLLDVHEFPNAESRILRTLRDNERVYLTGRHDNGWVELREGGWVPNYYLHGTPDKLTSTY